MKETMIVCRCEEVSMKDIVDTAKSISVHPEK